MKVYIVASVLDCGNDNRLDYLAGVGATSRQIVLHDPEDRGMKRSKQNGMRCAIHIFLATC